MNFNCKLPNHQNGCVCPPTGDNSHWNGAVSRSPWGLYVELSDDFIDVSMVDLNDPNSENQINRGYQQEEFLRVTRLSGWTPRETTDQERAFVATLRGVERRTAQVALFAREVIIHSRQTGDLSRTSKDEAQDAWDEANKEQTRRDATERQHTPASESEPDIDLMGEAS